MSSVDMPVDLKARLFTPIVHTVWAGLSRPALGRIVDAVRMTDWHWPAIDQWALTFERQGLWPGAWAGYRDSDALGDEPGRRAECVRLLALTVATAVLTARRSARYGGIANSSRERWRLAVPREDAGLPILVEMRERVDAGDLSELPPYFPGDRTVLGIDRVEPLSAGRIA